MAYEVLARKWRSQNFQELVGQNHITTTLLNALRKERLPHALLFTGTRGTGKTSTARILAKSLCCPNAQEFVPCGTCRSCQDIAAGRSIDVIEIDGASNNGVDSIRELRESVGYMPSQGKYKVYIIDEVHMLTTSAFNALLKTLEEPPNHAIFILATTEAQKIPNTILSRCQRFDFRRIPSRQIADHLTKICKAENMDVHADALWLIARQADGSMRDAQSLLDQVVSFCSGQTVNHERVIEVLGLTDRALLLETLSALTHRDAQKILGIIEKIFKAGYDAKIFAQEFLEEIRHALIARMIDPQQVNLENVLDLPQNEIESLRALTQNLTEEDLHMLFDMTLKGVQDLLRAQDSRLVLEILLLRMAAAPRIQNIQQLLQIKEKLQAMPLMQQSASNQTSPAAVTPNAPQPTRVFQPQQASATSPTRSQSPAQNTTSAPAFAPPSASSFAPQNQSASANTSGPIFQNLSPQAQNDMWFKFVEKVKRSNGLLGAILENTQLLQIEATHLIIGIPPKMGFLLEKLKEPDNQKRIEKFIETQWNKKFGIRVQMMKESSDEAIAPKQIEQKKIQEEEKSIEKQIENHPLVRSTQKLFKAQIKSIKESSKPKA